MDPPRSVEPPRPTESPYHTLFADYGCYRGEGYLEVHFPRYVETLRLLDGEHPRRIVELGVGNPPAFTLMLRARFPDADLSVSVKGPEGAAVAPAVRWAARPPIGSPVPPIELPCAQFNIETDEWPYASGSIDVVLCMEMLEHLVVDPYYVFLEANRVLRDGGLLVLTTPNIVGFESVEAMLAGRSPHTYGRYSQHGAYGRHNREFVPGEVRALGERAGFATAVLTTRDVYPPALDTTRARKVIAEHGPPGEDPSLRGQTIFYLGRKQQAADLAYPTDLYDYDPSIHRATIDVLAMDGEVAAGAPVRFRIRVTNRGTYTWRDDLDDQTILGVVLLNGAHEVLALDHHRTPLPHPVAPGEELVIEASAPAPPAPGRYALRFDLVHEYVCWFSETQRVPDVPSRDFVVLPPDQPAGWMVADTGKATRPSL